LEENPKIGHKGGRNLIVSGNSVHTIDAKGRMFIPTKFIEILGNPFKLFIWGRDRSLYAMSKDEFEYFSTHLKLEDLSKADAKRIKRGLFANTEDMEMDAQNRILIPAGMREHANLKKDVVIIGVDKRVELWDADTWNVESKSDKDVMADKIGELPEDYD
jgi:MraZ protein